jgi:hypothetical protein
MALKIDSLDIGTESKKQQLVKATSIVIAANVVLTNSSKGFRIQLKANITTRSFRESMGLIRSRLTNCFKLANLKVIAMTRVILTLMFLMLLSHYSFYLIISLVFQVLLTFFTTWSFCEIFYELCFRRKLHFLNFFYYCDSFCS